jgi:hypothetical protein
MCGSACEAEIAQVRVKLRALHTTSVRRLVLLAAYAAYAQDNRLLRKGNPAEDAACALCSRCVLQWAVWEAITGGHQHHTMHDGAANGCAATLVATARPAVSLGVQRTCTSWHLRSPQGNSMIGAGHPIDATTRCCEVMVVVIRSYITVRNECKSVYTILELSCYYVHGGPKIVKTPTRARVYNTANSGASLVATHSLAETGMAPSPQLCCPATAVKKTHRADSLLRVESPGLY